MTESEISSTIIPALEHDGFRLEKLEGAQYESPVINKCARYVMILHLVCFLLMTSSKLYLPSKLTSNAMSVKVLLNFITVPFQLFIIFYLEFGWEQLRFKIGDASECKESLIISGGGPVCVSKDWGNVKQWVWIELITFYLNILSLMFFLLQNLISTAIETREASKNNEMNAAVLSSKK